MTISPRFGPTAALLIALAVVASSCGGDDDGAAPPANDSVTDETGSADPSASVVDPTGGTQGNGGDTPPEVGSVIQGIAVAGNAGGTGESNTEPYSQTIRFEDGSCRGWTPQDTEVPSTEGLEAGASVTIRDDSGEEIGSGGVESSTSFPVDENGNRIDEDQGTATWRCEFSFSANLTVSTPPDVVFVQVAGLDPWAASFDSSRGQFVAIVPGRAEPATGGTTTVSTLSPSGTAPDSTPPPPDTTPPPPPDSAPPSVPSPDVTTPTS